MNTSGVDEVPNVGTEDGVSAEGSGMGVSVGKALCVAATAGLIVGVDLGLLQDASVTAARNKAINVLP